MAAKKAQKKSAAAEPVIINGIVFSRENETTILMEKSSKDSENAIETRQIFRLAADKENADQMWQDLADLQRKQNRTDIGRDKIREALDTILPQEASTDPFIHGAYVPPAAPALPDKPQGGPLLPIPDEPPPANPFLAPESKRERNRGLLDFLLPKKKKPDAPDEEKGDEKLGPPKKIFPKNPPLNFPDPKNAPVLADRNETQELLARMTADGGKQARAAHMESPDQFRPTHAGALTDAKNRVLS